MDLRVQYRDMTIAFCDETSSVPEIPCEIAHSIFQKFETRDLFSTMNVNRQWYHLSSKLILKPLRSYLQNLNEKIEGMEEDTRYFKPYPAWDSWNQILEIALYYYYQDIKNKIYANELDLETIRSYMSEKIWIHNQLMFTSVSLDPHEVDCSGLFKKLEKRISIRNISDLGFFLMKGMRIYFGDPNIKDEILKLLKYEEIYLLKIVGHETKMDLYAQIYKAYVIAGVALGTLSSFLYWMYRY
ncbi:MAG: hypothetical protein K940chlam3_00523 [Chlamydiae bacterium]|nr:hypothetical protein [Chlamydiota bacterium]